MALPTNQSIAPERNTPAMREANQEQPFHPIYNYAVVTDADEGLILVDVNTFADGEPRNNNIKRAVTWNEGRSEEHTSELQSLMRISYAVFFLQKKHNKEQKNYTT